MKKEILLELANRWEEQARMPTHKAEENNSPTVEEALAKAKAQGERETLRMCADTIRTLVDYFG